MIKIVSKIFSGKRIAFLAKTYAALNNIKIRVGTDSMNDYDFSTVDKFVENPTHQKYDLIIVDERRKMNRRARLKSLLLFKLSH